MLSLPRLLVAVAVLWLLPVPSRSPAIAVVLAPLAVARLWVPPAAVAVLLTPVALATDACPDE